MMKKLIIEPWISTEKKLCPNFYTCYYYFIIIINIIIIFIIIIISIIISISSVHLFLEASVIITIGSCSSSSK